jgi:hypothetical protein
MSTIRIDIASEFKEKGFKKAEKATTSLEDRFKRLGGTIAATFSAQQVINFGRQAMKAFIEDEQAATRFEQALKGVNLGFATPEIERYLDGLEAQSAVLKDDLRPAFQSLAQTTRSVTMSQDLLSTAIDVAAGSGVDLQTVVRDLSRAFVGNNQGLSKYNLGLSKTELRTASFAKVQQRLNDQFSGQRAAYLETYAGRLEQINVAYDKMQETIGGALLDSFQMLAGEGGIGGATTAMEQFGYSAADAIRGIGVLISGVRERIPFLDQLQYLSQFPQAMALLNKLMDIGKGQRPLFFPTGGIGQPAIDKRMAAIEEAAIARQKELEKLRAKSLREQEKANRLKRISIMLMEKEKKFDLTRIQLQAAMQGKLTAEEQARVQELMKIEEIKQAIAEQDVEKAEKLMDELLKLQKETEVLAETLIDLKAGNPFSEWDGYFANAKKLITDLYASLAANQKLVDDMMKSINDSRAAANAAVMAAKTDKATAYSEAAEASGNYAALAAQDAAKAINDAAAAIAVATSPQEKAAAEEGMRAALEYQAGVGVLTESVAAAEMAAALAGLELANEYLNQSIEAATGQGLIPEVNVTVNVSGNVTTEQDLVETITDQLYQYQKSGKGLLYSAVAI